MTAVSPLHCYSISRAAGIGKAIPPREMGQSVLLLCPFWYFLFIYSCSVGIELMNLDKRETMCVGDLQEDCFDSQANFTCRHVGMEEIV